MDPAFTEDSVPAGRSSEITSTTTARTGMSTVTVPEGILRCRSTFD